MATYEQLIAYLKGKGYNFSIEVEDVGPTDEFTLEEQEEQCCGPVDTDECADDGKVEPWSGWSDEEKEAIGDEGGVTTQELFQLAEQRVGKGNVHLEVKIVGPSSNCGTKETEWSDKYGCCESPSELLKGAGVTSVTRGETYDFSVSAGELPASWHVIGTGVEVSGTNTTAIAYINDCFCKPAVLYAQDTCDSVAPWILSASDGSWATIADTELSSPFGWFQDGSSSNFYVIGLNGDNTQISTQYFFEAGEYVGTEEIVCGTSFPGINTSPIATPQDSQGFTKCPSNNVWIRLKEGFTNVYDVRHAVDSQGTSEYTPGACEDELEYIGSGQTIADSSSLIISWSDGIPPYSLKLDGIEIYVDESKTKTEQYGITRTWWKIWSNDTCGMIYAVVTDSCGSSVQGDIRATTGSFTVSSQHSTDNASYVAAFPEVIRQPVSGTAYAWSSGELIHLDSGKYRRTPYSSPGTTATNFTTGLGGAYSIEICTDNIDEQFYYDPESGIDVLKIYDDDNWGTAPGPLSNCPDGGLIPVTRYHQTSGSLIYIHEWGC